MERAIIYLIIFIQLFVFNLTTDAQELCKVFQSGHSTLIQKIEFNNNGDFIGSIAGENELIIWEVKSGKQFATLKGHTAKINDFVFSTLNSDEVVTCSEDSLVIFWNYKIGKEISRIKTSQANAALCFSNLGNNLLAVGKDLIEIEQNKSLIIANGINGNAVSCDSFGNLLISSPSEKKIKWFDLNNKKIIRTKNGLFSKIIYSHSSNSFFLLGKNTTIKEITVDRQKETIKSTTFQEQGAKKKFNAIISTKEEIIAAGGEQNIYFYDKKSFRSHFLYGHTDFICSLAANKQETIIASASADNTIILWDMFTQKEIMTLKGNFEQINTVLFTPDCESLSLGSKTATLKYWHLRSNTFYKSNIELSDNKRSKGWKNTIVEIDSISGKQVFFTYVEYKTYQNSEQLKKINFYNGAWNYIENKITLNQIKKIDNWVTHFWNENKKNGSPISIDNLIYNVVKLKSSNSNILDTIKLKADSKITDLAYNSKYNFHAASSASGNIYFISPKIDSAEIVNVALLNDKDFIYSLSDNYYFGTKEAVSFMNVRYNSKLYGINKLDVIYNRPDIILSKLPYIDKSFLPKLDAALNSRRRKSKISSELTPEKILMNLPEVNSEVIFNKEDESCEIKVIHSEAIKLKEVKVKLNQVPIYSKEIAETDKTTKMSIKLNEGLNNLEVIGIDKNGYESLPINYLFKNDLKKNTKPNLYLICISGDSYKDSSFNLNYANKDINDVSQLLQKSHAFEKIKTISISGVNSTKKNIINESNLFLKEARANDIVIVFYAGHGLLDKNYDYYLGTYDINFNAPENEGLLFDDLVGITDKSISRNKLIFVDACHSGEIDKEEVKQNITATKNTDQNLTFRSVGSGISLMGNIPVSGIDLSKQLFNDLKSTNGGVIISASGGLEYAIERKDLKNGVFTYSLLEALKNKKADLNKDGKISLKELENYLPKRVISITEGKQKANTRTENNFLDFTIY